MTEQQTVAAAVARQVSLEPVLAELRPEFAKILPAHVGPERFERWTVTMLRNALRGRNSEAWQRVLGSPQGQMSVCSAFMDCAALGLEPGRTYHLVPFGSEVTGITDYKGEIQLINNASPSAVVVAQLVRAKDDFHMTGANVPPQHDADWFAADRGPVVGGYAYVDYGFHPVVERFGTGKLDEITMHTAAHTCSLVCRMGEDEFAKHREKARTKNVWDEWPEAMRLKTLIHQLRKWVPWSAEIR